MTRQVDSVLLNFEPLAVPSLQLERGTSETSAQCSIPPGTWDASFVPQLSNNTGWSERVFAEVRRNGRAARGSHREGDRTCAVRTNAVRIGVRRNCFF